jgi:diguanylate cyclase (GGDEF)-like protein
VSAHSYNAPMPFTFAHRDTLLAARKISLRQIPPLWTAAVFLVFMSIFALLTQAEYQKLVADERTQAINHGNMLRTRVDRELNSLLFISAGVSSYLSVYHTELDPEKLHALLADLYARSKHVRNLGVAQGYRITYVYPLKSNEKIIGVDFRDLPAQWPQVKQAIDSREGVLAGPLELAQGGKGLIYRYPIFIDDEYWGILSTVINTYEFLEAAFHGFSASDYVFAIRLKNAPAAEAFYGNPQLFDDPDAFLMTSQVPNGHWEWAIRKTSLDTPMLVFVIAGMGFVISLLLAWLTYHQNHERSRLALHALHDSLTGLANRRLLQERMLQAYQLARRFNRAMAVIYIDLDYFKRINDTHGHDFGDEYLRIAAKKLEGCLRTVDTLSRVGGDEFVVVLKEIGAPEDVRLVASHILARFSEPEAIYEINMRIELSLGIAILGPDSNVSLQELTKQADIALYEAKAAGRNTYRIYGEA